MPKITLNNVTVSDAYMALLADRGIDYWFANAGTDFAPVVEIGEGGSVGDESSNAGYLSPREYRHAHGHRIFSRNRKTAGGHGARQRRHCQRNEWLAQRRPGPCAGSVHGGPNADERRRFSRSSQPGYSLDAGDVRSGGNVARAGERGRFAPHGAT